MKLNGLLLGLLLACEVPYQELPVAPASEAAATTEPVLKVQVEQARVAEAAPIQVEHQQWLPDGWELQLGELQAPGLEIQLLSTSSPVDDGGRTYKVTRHELTGPDGRYIILPGEALLTSPDGETQTLRPPSIFVDIGVETPEETVLSEFEAVPEASPARSERSVPWIGWAIGMLLVGLLIVWAWRRWSRPLEVLSPMEQALRDWRQARQDGLDDQALAYQLSWIFRGYLEALDAWPARQRTSQEILTWLNSTREPPLGDELLGASERLLSATDRLKFAREGGGSDFFDALEKDLLHVLQATATETQNLDDEAQHG